MKEENEINSLPLSGFVMKWPDETMTKLTKPKQRHPFRQASG
jgi:hypothetical protein